MHKNAQKFLLGTIYAQLAVTTVLHLPILMPAACIHLLSYSLQVFGVLSLFRVFISCPVHSQSLMAHVSCFSVCMWGYDTIEEDAQHKKTFNLSQCTFKFSDQYKKYGITPAI